MSASDSSKMIAIIGGGASGFFAAINCKINFPNYQVEIFEKTNKTLSKVKVSGGGRCNVTHDSENRSHLANHYPRGKNQLKKVFGRFDNNNTVDWFKQRGVDLKIEADGRMFPTSDRSSTIINCFHDEIERLSIPVHHSCSLRKITKDTDGTFALDFDDKAVKADKVIIATGGAVKKENLDFLQELQIDIVDPVPSLFTFNVPAGNTADLMGQSVKEVQVKIQGTKLQSNGPILFTHWGFSGPAILKLSAFGARELAEKNYNFKAIVNWANENNEEVVRKSIQNILSQNHNKQIGNIKAFEGLSNKIWEWLLKKADIPLNSVASELPKKSINKLVSLLCSDEYHVQGKTTFKEEFVTCGGVNLNEVNFKTMESKKHPGLYFTGEVLDVDAVTGGFNFQAAWSTAHLAAKLLSSQ